MIDVIIWIFSLITAVGIMFIIKSKGWDFWNDEKDRWK